MCRPELVESDKPFFEAEDMRHPCVSPKLGGQFIPNSIRLGHPHQPLILLTGILASPYVTRISASYHGNHLRT